MDNLTTTLADFRAHLNRLRMYRLALSTVSYDAHTIAPKGAVAMRAKRDGFFAAEMYAMTTGEKAKGLLEAMAPHADKLDPIAAAEYRLAKKTYDNSTKIPADMVRKFSELRSKAYAVWEQARKDNDFASFAPYLKDIIEMRKQMTEYRRVDDKPLYDVMLDDYEEGMAMEIYDEYFTKLRAAIVPLLKGVMASPKKIDKAFAYAPVSIDEQRKLSDFVAAEIGYDINRGHIGETAHPFCNGIHRDDVRITTRYDENDFLSSFYSIMHECGHAIYEQNMGDDIAESIVASGVSSGIHESQSRFYENIIGRSEAFWDYLTDGLKKYLPASYQNITARQFYEAANEAKPSLIRVEADELTYSLHCLIRYEIERMIFMDGVDVNDLPAIWNAKYQEYLGVTPPDDANGVLQDVHWSGGMFGYFPTYSIGSAYASQFAAYMRREMDVDGLIRSGNFAEITKWLKDKIHQHGSVLTPKQLVEKIAGEGLNADYYVEYLNKKFGELYQL